MFVTVVQTQMKPADVEEATQLWREQVAPVMKDVPGFLRGTLVGDASTGSSLVFNVWASDADAAAFRATGQDQTLLGLFTGYYTAPPSVNRYEVLGEV